MLTRHQMNNRENIFIMDMDKLVPSNHLVRKIDKAIDFSFIYDIVKFTTI